MAQDNFGGGGGYMQGAPQGAPAPQGGVGRFAKEAAIGGVIGGVLSGIPGLNILNCCFCLLNMAGVAIGLSMYFKNNPTARLSSGDAATFGAMAGAVTGVIAGLLGLVVNLALADQMASIYQSLGPQYAQMASQQGATGICALPIGMIIYAAFGALGGFLSMQFLYKDRSAS